MRLIGFQRGVMVASSSGRLQPAVLYSPCSAGGTFRDSRLNYVSLCPADHEAALDYYASLLGPLDVDNPEDGVWGWKMGRTWLTVFPGRFGPDPDATTRNVEFAIEMTSPDEVDRLFDAFVAAGVKASMAPSDTRMYESMRYAYVDDPFGMRIDIYCPLPED